MLRRKRITPIRRAACDEPENPVLRSSQVAFLEWTRLAGLAEQTACIRRHALNYFIRWCSARKVEKLEEITHDLLESYQSHLFHYRKVDGRPLAMSTQVTRLNPIKAFCKWLARTRRLASNPAVDLAIPRVPRRLPGRIPSVREVQSILSIPEVACAQGVRDRAILEVLYATGIRRMELVALRLCHISFEKETLLVRAGKGNRDRVIPLGWRASAWLRRYVAEVRPRLLGSQPEDTLFLTDFGEPFRKNRLGDFVKKCLVNARIHARGACHLFRHACATHMLENGADIRFIQALLGHADLSTTQIYTHVSIAKLQEVHATTHPAAMSWVPRPLA